MKIKRKHNETMLWIDSIKTLVKFGKDGYANVTDEKIAKEMYKLGYPKGSEEPKNETVATPKVVKPLTKKAATKGEGEETVDYKV